MLRSTATTHHWDRGTDGSFELLYRRQRCLWSFLEQRPDEASVLLVDTDLTFLKPPLDSLPAAALAADVAILDDSGPGRAPNFTTHGVRYGVHVNAGFMLLRNTPRTRAFGHMFLTTLADQRKEDGQAVLNDVAWSMVRSAGLQLNVLDPTVFLNGFRYFEGRGMPTCRESKWCVPLSPHKIAAIHHNWVPIQLARRLTEDAKTGAGRHAKKWQRATAYETLVTQANESANDFVRRVRHATRAMGGWDSETNKPVPVAKATKAAAHNGGGKPNGKANGRALGKANGKVNGKATGKAANGNAKPAGAPAKALRSEAKAERQSVQKAKAADEAEAVARRRGYESAADEAAARRKALGLVDPPTVTCMMRASGDCPSLDERYKSWWPASPPVYSLDECVSRQFLAQIECRNGGRVEINGRMLAASQAAGGTQHNKQRCACESDSARWAPPPPPAAPARCVFIDLGLNDGNTVRVWYNDSAAYGPGAHNQLVETHNLLERRTYPELKARGFAIRQCRNIGVEMMAKYTPRLHSVREQVVAEGYAKTAPTFYLERALSTCDGATVEYTVNSQGTDGEMSSDLRRAPGKGKGLRGAPMNKFKKRVDTLNLLRLLHENVRPKDYVVLKMDVEGTEYEVVPCLATSPAIIALIDQFYLEEHPSYVTAQAVATMEKAKAAMRATGMLVSSEWP